MIATSFVLACFAGTILLGLYNGNGWSSIMISAVSVGFIAWVVGLVIGSVLLRSVNEQIERHRAEHPIPGQDNPDQSSNDTDGPRTAMG